ncbi:MAG: isoprenylcysteine carboxylmethyltransferase family protein [Betaproteobacteria bacterium]
MHALELKVPPPAVGLTVAAAMWAIASVTPARLALPNPGTIATVLALVGLAFDMTGLVAFMRAKTTINPLRPGNSTALVTSGVYRITRNPMYSGMLFMLLGWAVYLDSPWALLGPLAFVLYINRFQIVPEERVLQELFGDQFTRYKERVRRWL